MLDRHRSIGADADSGRSSPQQTVPVGAADGLDDPSRIGLAGLAPSPSTGSTDDDRLLGTGTTTVGLVATDAVVLATDRRASVGGGRFVTSREAEKLHAVHPRAAVTIAGSVAGAQAFVEGLRAEASLTATRRGEPLSIPALASLGATLLRQGFGVTPLLGGVDEDGPHLFEADMAGGLMEKRVAATGSGMALAYGTLEGATDDDLEAVAARELAVEAVAAASERDTASGNGAVIATITADGIERETRTVVEP